MGTPQGGVISPLLANIYLNPLDWLMKEAGLEMVRYADDMVVLCRHPQEAERALGFVRSWMETAGLALHPEKTRIVSMDKVGNHFDFLGYRFWRGKKHGKIRRFVRPKSKAKLRERLKPHTRRSNGQSLPAIIAKINPILKGWYGYFRQASADALQEIDGWIRGRLRSILRKRRHGKGRGRGLDQQRWGNSYFAENGLFSLELARASVKESLADRRAGCGSSASPVRRGERSQKLRSHPIPRSLHHPPPSFRSLTKKTRPSTRKRTRACALAPN